MKLFIKDNKGYIVVYSISIFITLGYLALSGFVQIGECLYILLFNTFYFSMFFIF